MSCIVLDVDFAEKNNITELGVFIIENVQGYPYRPPRTYKPTKQAVWCTENLHGMVWNSGRLNYSELAKIFPSDVKGEIFAEETKKARFLAD